MLKPKLSRLGVPAVALLTLIVFLRIWGRCRYAGHLFEPFKPPPNKKVILVTGGAGFIGSHLVDVLTKGEDNFVIVIDNFETGSAKNIRHLLRLPNFKLIRHDVVDPIWLDGIDQVYHLASPASPFHYMLNSIKTVKTNTIGTMNMLGLCKRTGARFLLASTSEVYGDPLMHPQKEEYFGNVNSVGPRSCYDESKRLAETLTASYSRRESVDVRIARIFNTYGPRMQVEDGRIISSFVTQALMGKPLTIFGNGNKTRSFQFVGDLVEGLIRLMENDYSGPVNIGNPVEMKVRDIAEYIVGVTKSKSDIVMLPPLEDDPNKRKPDIRKAMKLLKWRPRTSLETGIGETVRYFCEELHVDCLKKHIMQLQR